MTGVQTCALPIWQGWYPPDENGERGESNVPRSAAADSASAVVESHCDEPWSGAVDEKDAFSSGIGGKQRSLKGRSAS